MLYGPTVIIVIIVIIIVIVIIGLSVIIDIIVLIAIMITSLSTDLFIRYNFIRFGCMDSAQHYLDSIKCIPPNSHGTAYTVRARNIYIYIYIYILAFLSALVLGQLCVCLVLFCRKHRKRFWANLSYCLETISG